MIALRTFGKLGPAPKLSVAAVWVHDVTHLPSLSALKMTCLGTLAYPTVDTGILLSMREYPVKIT